MLIKSVQVGENTSDLRGDVVFFGKMQTNKVYLVVKWKILKFLESKCNAQHTLLKKLEQLFLNHITSS